MLKKIVLILSFLFFSVSSYAVENSCSLDVYSSDCLRFYEPFVEFDLYVNNSDFFESKVEAYIYNKEFVSNKISVEFDEISNILRNVEPLVESGIYVLRASVYNKAGVIRTKSYEFIFDNTELMPPVIDINLVENDLNFDYLGDYRSDFVDVYMSLEEMEISSRVEDGIFKFEDVSLSEGLNVVDFYVRDLNGRESQKIKRIVYGGGLPEVLNVVDEISVVSNLDSLNLRTIFKDNVYYTTSQNFYVEAYVTPNSRVFFNGILVVSDLNGRAGQVLLLNEGRNKVVVENFDGSVLDEVVVDYVNDDFRFTSIDFDKVFDDYFEVSGSVNVNLPFDLFVNGNLVEKKIFAGDDLNFFLSVSLDNFVSGKNFVYLRGFGVEEYYDIVYYDVESPVVEFVSFEDLKSSEDELVFRIGDDVGIDADSIMLSFGAQEFGYNVVDNRGDYYVFDIEDVEDGNYLYEISISDRVGRVSSLRGNFSKGTSEVFIKDILIDDAEVVGRDLYVDGGRNEIEIVFNDYVAFDKIFVDDYELTSYEIRDDMSVLLDIDFENRTSGKISFDFIDYNRNVYSYSLNYFTDLEVPKISFDYIYNSYFTDNKFLRVSGRVDDSYFDWDSLVFEGVDFFRRFGNFFEFSYGSKLEGFDDLVYHGADMVGNSFKTYRLSNFGYGDFDVTQVNFVRDSLALKGSFDNYASTFNYVCSYDGFDFDGLFLQDNFGLSYAQRNGLRALRFEGKSNSLEDFYDLGVFSVDSVEPRIYPILYNGNYVFLIDGTFSDVSDISVEYGQNGVSFSECDLEKFVFEKCVDLGSQIEGSLNLLVKDSFGNVFEGVFIREDFKNLDLFFDDEEIEPKIYFSGNDRYTKFSKNVISGQVKTDSVLKSVRVEDGQDCLFDEYNFVCEVELDYGENVFDVVVVVGDKQISKNYSLYLDNRAPEILITDITGDRVLEFSGSYYVGKEDININTQLDEDSIVKLYLGLEEYILDEYDRGNFFINFDLSDVLEEQEYASMNLTLTGEDSQGNVGRSNSVKLLFSKFVQTLISVVVE